MVKDSFKWDVFVSHNRRQKLWVRQFVAQLRDHGLQVFFDEDSIPPGIPVLTAIEQGVDQSRYLLFVITPSSVASEWVSLETSLLLFSDPAARHGRLIPLLLEKTPETDIRPAVRILNWTDLTKPQERTRQYQILLRHLGIEETLTPPAQGKSRKVRSNVQTQDPLLARRALRVQLTDITCLLYKDAYDDPAFLVVPDGMPVLSQKKFLPDVPLLLPKIEEKLVWRKSMDAVPQQYPQGPMVATLRAQLPSPQIHDGILYRFLGSDDGKEFHFCRGSYFDFLNSCEYLSLELASAIHDNRFAYEILQQEDSDNYRQVVSFLLAHPNLIPLRLATDPFTFESRCTAFGTCALVIVKRTNKPARMILNMRSSALTETPDLLHVIPAGTFQPNMFDDRFHEIEFSFTENLVREFAEELLDAEDLRRPKVEPLDPEEMYSRRGKTFRQHVVRNGNYSIFYLGTVVDPVNLKPEILTVFMVHEGFLFNVDKRELVKSWESGRLSLHEFTEGELDYLIGKSNFVPTGKAHLMLVRKHFRFLSDALSQI